MENYKLTITSNINSNVGQTVYFNSTLNKGILLDILTPITPYKIEIEPEKYKSGSKMLWNLEGAIMFLLETELKTKVAKNLTSVKKEELASFKNKPNLELNCCEDDFGQMRTYVSTYFVPTMETMFPKLFTMDFKSKKFYYPGKLVLQHNSIKDNYVLLSIKTVDTVVYEEITLVK